MEDSLANPDKIEALLKAGEQQLSPEDFEQLQRLLSDLAIYGLTPRINTELAKLLGKIEWELGIEPSPAWPAALQACDYAFLGEDLRRMCSAAGVSSSGHKKELCERLYRAGVPEVVKVMVPYLRELVGVTHHSSQNPQQIAYVEKLPKCDFCDKLALYDGRTIIGPWAHMCEDHFRTYGVGLGVGKGQKLVARKVLEEAEKIRMPEYEEQSVTMTEDDFETATLEGLWHPICPYCGAETPAEPDAHAVYCQACNRRFKIINPFFS